MKEAQEDRARPLSNSSDSAAPTSDPEKGLGAGTQAAAQDIERESQNDSAGDTKDSFLVHFEDGDQQNPQNWSMTKKWCLVAFLSWITLLT